MFKFSFKQLLHKFLPDGTAGVALKPSDLIRKGAVGTHPTFSVVWEEDINGNEVACLLGSAIRARKSRISYVISRSTYPEQAAKIMGVSREQAKAWELEYCHIYYDWLRRLGGPDPRLVMADLMEVQGY